MSNEKDRNGPRGESFISCLKSSEISQFNCFVLGVGKDSTLHDAFDSI